MKRGAVCVLVCLLAGCGGERKVNSDSGGSGFNDDVAVRFLKQAEWELKNTPDNKDRWSAIRTCGSYVTDHDISEPVRQRLYKFLVSIKDDKNAYARNAAREAIGNAPKYLKEGATPGR